MEQHPIPQQISSYEFKLVGDMTLKQFGKAAGGIILAVLINTTPLPFFIKWPLMLVLAAGGLALAFLPYQDRPLETWIGAFLKSIYSPTVFMYKKKKPENWLDIDLTKEIKTNKEEKIEVLQKEESKVKEFIESLPSVERERRIKEDLKPEEIEKIAESMEEKTETRNPPSSRSSGATAWQDQKQEQEAEGKTEGLGVESRPVGPKLDLKTHKLEATGDAVFGSIPMPSIPETPNVLVGMVLNHENKIVEGAIVDLQDKNGNSARVLKTNQLGQFKTLTPLSSGKYLVVTEKDDLKFDRVEIELDGKIVQPLKIIAKA